MATRTPVVGATALALGLLALAGCGSSPAHRSDKLVAARVLSTANRTAWSTSFTARIQGTVRLTLSDVSGLPSQTLKRLQQLQQQLNSTSISGSIRLESPTDFEVTYSFPPFLPSPLEVIYAGGTKYASSNGTQWHRLGPSGGAGSLGKLPFEIGSLPAALRALGSATSGATTITSLPATTVDGVAVDHLRAVVSGTGLARILTGGLGAGSSTGGSGAATQALSALVNFQPATVDTYIGQRTRLPVLESASGGASLDLAALSLLGSTATAQAKGTVALGYDFTVTFSGYGSHFSIAAPTNVV
ncbi:MAG: hypothetical protein ACYCYK_14345, partial [Candidatus Dormibacteria bacterium]